MKKVIAAILSGGILALLIPVVVSAAPPPIPNVTEVYGVVSNNGKAVTGAKVIVICNSHDKKTTTTALISGSPSYNYLVTFPAGQCAPGSNITVTATKGAKGGERGGQIVNVSTDLNVALVNVSLPEFGAIAGFGAAIIGGGAFLVTRRRHLSDHQA